MLDPRAGQRRQGPARPPCTLSTPTRASCASTASSASVDPPVGIWSTFANHGTVNHYQFTYYNEDHHGAATHLVERAIRRKGDVPEGQDVVDAYGNTDEGDQSSGLDKWGPAQADHVGTVEARKFMAAWRQAGKPMDRTPTLARRWTRMCFCGQQTAAGPVANKGVFGQAEFTGSEEGAGRSTTRHGSRSRATTCRSAPARRATRSRRRSR